MVEVGFKSDYLLFISQGYKNQILTSNEFGVIRTSHLKNLANPPNEKKNWDKICERIISDIGHKAEQDSGP